MCLSSDTHETLKACYDNILNSSKDLQTSACCCTPIEVKAASGEIDHEIIQKFYACGSPICKTRRASC